MAEHNQENDDKGEFGRFEAIASQVDPQGELLRSWNLVGGVSAQVTGMELVQPDGQLLKLVVRQHGERDRALNPQVAATEFRLLKLLEATDVRAPKAYLHDDSGVILPDPYIVIEYLEGDTNAPPAEPDEVARQMADYLLKVHAVKAPEFDLSFLSTATGLSERPPVLDESLQEGRIRDALEFMILSGTGNPPCLLHGDYWPGNILWDDGRLVTAVDWENVEQGDPLIDLGNTRLELLFFYGLDVMDAFTDRYRSSSPADFSVLPYWDLCAALRPAGRMGDWGLDATTEKAMREGHKIFVERAFDDLAKQ